MSGYVESENSWHSAAPIELYHFYNTGVDARYSSGPTVVFESDEYVEYPVGRENISQTKEIHKAPISVFLPRNSPLSMLYLVGYPESIPGLTIYRANSNSLYDYVVYWKGRVVSVSWPDAVTAKLSCESIFTALKRPGLRAKYQRMCRHALYSTQCGVNRATFAVAGTVTYIDEANKMDLAIDGIDALPEGWFNGGFIKTESGGYLSIESSAYNSVRLTHPSSLLEYDTVTLYPGCSRQREMCRDKFNNLLNYGGFPWIPSRNPFDGRSLV